MTQGQGDPVLLRPTALGGAGIGDWFCVTVVRAHPDPLRDGRPTGGPDRAPGPVVPVAVEDFERLAEVAARIGADPAALVAWDRDLGRFWDADDAAPVLLSLVVPDAVPDVVPHPVPAVVLLEVNGFEGSRPEVLTALSRGAEVVSLFRGVHSSRLSYAVDGRLLVTLDPAEPHVRHGERPDALGDDLDELLSGALPLEGGAEMLALDVVRRRTGVALDAAWWQGTHLLAAVEPLDADESVPGLPDAVEAALDEIGRQTAADPTGAVADLLLATLQDAVRAALHFTGLAEDDEHGPGLAQAVAEARILRRLAVEARPAAFEAAQAAAVRSPDEVAEPDETIRSESIAAQQRVAGTVAALWEAYSPGDLRQDAGPGRGRPGAPFQEDDPLWHRLQAGIAVTELLAWAVAPANPYDDAHSPADVLLHVRFALADRWPAFEDALAAHLEAHLG
ncbi:DUF6461 domain-containing protein [Kineosporia sp. A_224]|uniref:DUF6461 domain-containing protein n=1 Tax=Kineosporia sp. A_224 TaxID=1962180 RepID=UPI000B4C16B1|nr:DUF6461 domain-containing protein [Kineosporia sp. A_224]